MPNSSDYWCPDEYIGKLFLAPEDIKNIFGMHEHGVYEYIRSAPFRCEKIGAKYYINARSFWRWYNTGL